MKRILQSAAFSLFALAAVMGCQEQAPSVLRGHAVHKTLPPGRLASAAKKVTTKSNAVSLSADAAASESTDPSCNAGGGGTEEAATECTAWHEDISNTNNITGDFEYLNSCAEGGDIASIHTVGHGDDQGNGTYTQTYNMRDGSQVVWQYSYTLGADGASQVYSGTSSDGTVYTGTYRYPSENVTEMHEVYTLPNNGGVSTVDGSYDAQQRFTGTQTFDDPATPDTPDTRLVQTENDLGLRQEYQYVAEGWAVNYTAFYPAEGGLEYSWRSDDRATLASPDYDGSYTYAADNSGHGSYVQKFDDGSSLDVTHVIAADGSYDESWVWHDATTAQDPDQNASVHYTPCAGGVGTVTTFVQGGNPETCDLHVAQDGTTTTDNCH